jgi:hypothetical protein
VWVVVVVVWVVVVALVVLKIPPEKTVEAYMRITGCPHAHTMVGIGGTSCIRLDMNGWRSHKHMRVYIRGFTSRHSFNSLHVTPRVSNPPPPPLSLSLCAYGCL